MSKPSALSIVVMAIRPKTLGAAIAPVLLGTATAYASGNQQLTYAVLALLGALFIQIGTNLANDYFDFVQGADTEDRKGPTRVTQAGYVTPNTVKWAFILTFGAAALIGLPLMLRGGWPIVIVGIVSIAAGILYTSGPYALAYLGLGDIFVLIFFGPVAVAGTHYVQTLQFDPIVALLGIGPGLVATGILAVNNLRDVDEDRVANKRTLAVRFGRTFARIEHTLCFVIPALLPVVLWLLTKQHPYAMLATLILVPASPIMRTVWTTLDGNKLNHALAATGKMLILYSILLSAGWAFS
jgi:1,4-dihydroxy-2-naphthoate octaprenyltransferase